jgi:hypothetical protein
MVTPNFSADALGVLRLYHDDISRDRILPST